MLPKIGNLPDGSVRHPRANRVLRCALALLLAAFAAHAAPRGSVLSTEGRVERSATNAPWAPAAAPQPLDAGDRVRTLESSRALLQLAELGRVRLDQLTTLEVLPPRNAQSKGTLDLKSGALYFFTRDKPREFELRTPQALAASRGTEFAVTLEPDGREVVTVFDGEVDLTNSFGGVTLARGEQGLVEAGRAPRKTAVIEARRVVQWWLYYAAVLDADELFTGAPPPRELDASLDLYRRGDIPGALRAHPEWRPPANAAERAYLAQLLLAAGQVAQAESLLAATANSDAAAGALRRMIAVVQSGESAGAAETNAPANATDALVRSYELQARLDLDGALQAARDAATRSPGFAFAWARIAELEFGFGRTAAAREALARALELAPRHAQARALEGFLLSAARHWEQAGAAFDDALALDPALGNAWLGRGLLRIRRGERDAGRADLQTAAALEPGRSLLRSYLGKAFDHAGDADNAARELALARALDDADPTPWLYNALLLRQELRYNESVRELEESAARNDNRQVYRSRLLLDQDRAVRGASLATIYRAAGMNEVSVREATRAVTADYANPSAHRFLAESFDALRDPTRFNLRNETVWFNELLLANMLAPVGAANLSQNISQQEYARLFEADRFGLSSLTDYRSDGQVREIASQFGTVGRFSYAFDLDYQHNDGIRPNNELDRLEAYLTAKYQVGERDTFFLLMKYQDFTSGDNFQYYNPNGIRTDLFPFGITNASVVRTNFTFTERQRPIAVAGLHHEWAPGVHTLFLGGRLENEQFFSDTDTVQAILLRNPPPATLFNQRFNVAYESTVEIYTAELNQIVQTDRHLTIAGGRYQNGTFETRDQLTLGDPALAPFFNTPPAAGNFTEDFERVSLYAYHTWEVVRRLHLTGGIAYDQVTYPRNYRQPPVSGGTETHDQFSPKAALVWAPVNEVTVRGVYTKSLGGVTLDESYRLEPAQLAGFSQAFRTLIPESIAGSVTSPSYETAGLAVDLKFKSRTYAGVQAEWLTSDLSRQLGVFEWTGNFPPPPQMSVSSTTEILSYTEPSIAVSVNQLIGEAWSLGASYRYSRAMLDADYPELPAAARREEADLQQARFFVLYNHRSGFFARAESLWFHQKNRGYTPALAAEDFLQHNVFIGWRLTRQRGEIAVGILNLGDTDYRLNPLTAYAELPRERVYTARLRFNL